MNYICYQNIKRAWLFFFSVWFLTASSVALSQTTPVFGPEKYDRGKGKPEEIVKTFTVSNPDAEFTLSVENGDETQGRVSSAVITLNGVVVVSPDEFSQQVSTITKPVELNEQNEIGVEVRSQPGSSIVVTILGPDSDGNGFTIHTNPADPIIASALTNKGETVHFLGEKDGDGTPTKLTGARILSSDVTSSSDLIIYGDNKLPDLIALKDGSRIFFQYPSDDQVVMTIVLPDGTEEEVSFAVAPTNTAFGEQAAFSQSELSLESAVADQAPPEALVAVTLRPECGFAPVKDAHVSGAWNVVNGTQSGSFIADRVSIKPDRTIHRASFAVRPEKIDPTVVENSCDFIVDNLDQFCGVAFPSAVLMEPACAEFLLIPHPAGPALAAACVVGAISIQATCGVKKGCDIIKKRDLYFPLEKDIHINVDVSAREFSHNESKSFKGPHSSAPTYEFDFVDPSSKGLLPPGTYSGSARELYYPWSIDSPPAPLTIVIGDDGVFKRAKWDGVTEGNYTWPSWEVTLTPETLVEIKGCGSQKFIFSPGGGRYMELDSNPELNEIFMFYQRFAFEDAGSATK